MFFSLKTKENDIRDQETNKKYNESVAVMSSKPLTSKYLNVCLNDEHQID